MKLSKTGDFELVNKYYSEVLDIIKVIGGAKSSNIPKNLTKDRIVAFTYMIQSIRAICSNISLTVSQMNELSKDIDLEKLDEMMPNLFGFSNVGIKEEYIESEEDIDIKKQLRNCLAHASYNIIIENVEEVSEEGVPEGSLRLSYKDIYIEIDNPYIEGKIPYTDFVHFGIEYGILRSIFAKDPITFYKINPRFASLRNTAILDYALDTMRKIEFAPAKDDEEGTISPEEILDLCRSKYSANISNLMDLKNRFDNYENFNDVRRYKYIDRALTEEEKDFIKRYCKYLGFKRVEEITSDPLLNQEFYLDIIGSSLANRVVPGLNTCFQVSLQATFNSMFTPDLTPDVIFALEILRNNPSFKLLQYEGPILYSNMLLGMAYYNFDFIREANEERKRAGDEYFRFKDVDIRGSYWSIEDAIKEKNYMQNEITLKENKESDLKKILKAIRGKMLAQNILISQDKRERMREDAEEIFTQHDDINVENIVEKIVLKMPNSGKSPDELEKLIDSWLNKGYNPRSLTEDEKQVLKGFIDTLESFERNRDGFILRDLSTEIAELESQISAGNYRYQDSSDFFRYLRNSIAHGRYKIDYKDALSSGKFEKIQFHFEDYDIDENQNAVKVFDYSVKAGELRKMISDFEQTVLRQMQDGSYSQELFDKKTDMGVEKMPELV